MTIDASIPLRAAVPFSLSEIMERVERVKAMRSARERADWQWQQQKEDAERKANARGSLADLILNGSQPVNTPAPGGLSQMAFPSSDVAAPQQATTPQNPWSDYVRADPEGAMDYRSATTKWNAEQFDAAKELNDGVLQILGGVYDQASYQRSKNMARALYGRFGVNLDDFQLPEEYSPELVRQLQIQAMDTRHQLDTARRERQLDWDIEDDRLDNQRMDERNADLERHRRERRDEMRRNNVQRDATTRRGQDLVDSRVRARGTGSPRQQIVTVRTPAEAQRLAPGTRYRGPDGVVRER